MATSDGSSDDSRGDMESPIGSRGCLGDPMGSMEMFDGSSDHLYYKTQVTSSWIFGTNGLWWGTNGWTDLGKS